MPFDGLTASEIAARLALPRCHYLLRVTSTMDVIHELAADGAAHGTLVLAEEQVKGRGSHGRQWTSPPETGIWLSYLVRPDSDSPIPVVSLRVGMALASALESVQISPQLKWPNDVLIDGKKVAGTLCEARGSSTPATSWIAIGIGINVYGPVPEGFEESATFVSSHNREVTRLGLLEALVEGLGNLQLSERLTPEEIRAYEARDCLRERAIVSPCAGTVVGVRLDGALAVMTSEGEHLIYGGGGGIELG